MGAVTQVVCIFIVNVCNIMLDKLAWLEYWTNKFLLSVAYKQQVLRINNNYSPHI